MQLEHITPESGEQGDSLAKRREIAQRVLCTEIDWHGDGAAFLPCPGEQLHTSPSGPRDCILYLNGAPTLFCFHQGCRDEIAAANHELRSAIGSAERASGQSNLSAAVAESHGKVQSLINGAWSAREAKAAVSRCSRVASGPYRRLQH